LLADLVVAFDCGFCIWVGKGKRVKLKVMFWVSSTVTSVDVFLVVVVVEIG